MTTWTYAKFYFCARLCGLPAQCYRTKQPGLILFWVSISDGRKTIDQWPMTMTMVMPISLIPLVFDYFLTDMSKAGSEIWTAWKCIGMNASERVKIVISIHSISFHAACHLHCRATHARGWFWDNDPALGSGQGCSTPLMFSTSITTIVTLSCHRDLQDFWSDGNLNEVSEFTINVATLPITFVFNCIFKKEPFTVAALNLA